MYMCVYVSVCVYVCIYIYVCMYQGVCVCVYVSVRLYVCVYVYVYTLLFLQKCSFLFNIKIELFHEVSSEMMK